MNLKAMLVAGTLSSVMVVTCISESGGRVAQAAPISASKFPVVSSGIPPKLTILQISGTGQWTAPTAAEAEDIAAYEAQSKTSSEEDRIRFQDQSKFEEIAAKVSAEDAEEYVGAGFDFNDAKLVWVRFTTKPSAKILEMLGTLPYDVRVEFGSPLNNQKLLDASEAMYNAIRGVPGVSGVVSSVDLYSEEIHLEYSSQRHLDDGALLVAAKNAGTKMSSTGSFDGVVTVQYDPNLISYAQADIYGGQRLQNDVYSCTSGFGISVGGVKGTTTAMHCPNDLRYHNMSGVIQYANAASQTAGGNYIDLQWHRGINGNTAIATFQSDTNSLRTATGSQQPVAGSLQCHFGIGSNAIRCSTVYLFGICYKPEDLNFCGLVATVDEVSDGGDSGGPWFSGTNATGIHSGVAGVNDAPRSVFEPRDRITGNLNATILTS